MLIAISVGFNDLYQYHLCIDCFKAAPTTDGPVVDTAEQVYISSLALLKVWLSWLRLLPTNMIKRLEKQTPS